MREQSPSLYWSRTRASRKSRRKQTLRTQPLALLFCLLLSSVLLLMNTEHVSAQTPITTAKADLVAAFQSIQTAQRQGASNTDILPLIAQLNTALQYEENATVLGQRDPTDPLVSANALQSISLSTNVSLQAQRLGDEAQSASLRRSVIAYGLALCAATIGALGVVGAPRLIRLIRKSRLRRARIVYGGENPAR